MPTAPPYNLPQEQRAAVDFEIYANNGTVDTTSVAQLTFDNTKLQCDIDPGNPRRVNVKALGSTGQFTLKIDRATPTLDALFVPFNLQAPLNLSKVLLVGVTPLPPA